MRPAIRWLGRWWAKTGGAGAGWLLVCGGLALLAASANAAPTAPVEAAAPVAPAAQVGTQVVDRIHFSTTAPGRLCVGVDYAMPVTMLVDVQVGSGDATKIYQDHVLPGVSVQASIDDSAVASITPAALQSGSLPVDLLNSPPFVGAKGAGQVVFTLHAKKSGVTILHFQASVPSRMGAAPPEPIELPVTVQICGYKVTVTGSWKMTYKNLVTRLNETLQGEMKRDDNGALSGSADASWNLTSVSVMCSHDHVPSPSTGHLSGEQNGDTLRFDLNYDPFELTTVNCESGTHGPINVGSIEFKDFPATGASGSVTLPFPVGNEILIGKGTISIVPIEPK